MIRNSKYEKKLAEKVEICNKRIEDDSDKEFWEEKLVFYFDRLAQCKHIVRIVKTWEISNNKWFNGTVSDVATFDDLVNHCEESLYDEKPLDLIANGIYIPICGSAIAPWDLREFLYLPISLVEKDEKLGD